MHKIWTYQVHEPYTGFEKLVVYKDQMEGGLQFPLDPFVKSLLNRYNIASGQLHPNSYRILTGYLELMHREGVNPTLDMLRYVYSLTKKGELAFSFFCCAESQPFCETQRPAEILEAYVFCYGA